MPREVVEALELFQRHLDVTMGVVMVGLDELESLSSPDDSGLAAVSDISQSYCGNATSEAAILTCLGDSCAAHVISSLLFPFSQEEVKQKEVKQTIATVPGLSPSTLYCVQVQAFSEPYNKSSAYSQRECIQTPAGGQSPAIVPPLEVQLLPLPWRSHSSELLGTPRWAGSFTSQSFILGGSREPLNATFSGIFYP